MNVLSTNVFCTSQTTGTTVLQYLDAETFMEVSQIVETMVMPELFFSFDY